MRERSAVSANGGHKTGNLAADLGINQQMHSHIGQSETVEEETLERIAKALGVEKEAIKILVKTGV